MRRHLLRRLETVASMLMLTAVGCASAALPLEKSTALPATASSSQKDSPGTIPQSAAPNGSSPTLMSRHSTDRTSPSPSLGTPKPAVIVTPGDIAPTFPVQPTRIGVILPLSGRFAPVGAQVKRGIDLAMAKRPSSPDGPFTLLFRDTRGEPEAAAAAVHELVERAHVVAIIGPLVSAAVDEAAIAAAELQVPMVVLSQKEDIPYLGSYVFRNFMTPAAQVRQLVAYAMGTLELERFGILYPEQPYWMEMAGVFWDEVVARGGQVNGIESYPVNTTDFQKVAARLGRKHYTQLRSSEIQEGKRKMKEAYAKVGKKPPAKYELPPIVDYDAIFIADQYRPASLAAASLANTEFPVGGFKVAKDQDTLRLLGTSAWNTPDFLRQGAAFAEKAVFVDNFYALSPDPDVQEFVKTFQDEHQRTPDMFAAVGYDSALLLCYLQRDELLDRAGLLDRLSRVEGFKGVTGGLRFDEMGEPEKALFVVSVYRRKFKQVVPDPELYEVESEKPSEGEH